jgi:hypothetical protein
MSAAKHTPGPWRYTKHAVDEDYMLVFCGSDGDNLRGYCGEANARLIAAAPELLEALVNLLAVHECQGGTKYHAGDIARAAIAKATGKQA